MKLSTLSHHIVKGSTILVHYSSSKVHESKIAIIYSYRRTRTTTESRHHRKRFCKNVKKRMDNGRSKQRVNNFE